MTDLLSRLGGNPVAAVDEIASSVSTPEADTTRSAAFEAQQIVDLAKNSLDFLAGLAMPLIYRYAFPAVFLSVWAWLLSFVLNLS